MSPSHDHSDSNLECGREVKLPRFLSFLIKHNTTKSYGEVSITLHILNTLKDGDEWLASLSGRFTLMPITPLTHPTVAWVRQGLS